MLNFDIIFLYFFTYSIIGWICEVLYCRIYDKHFTNRGFLYGPYCPIYGFGGLIVLIVLAPCKENFILLFLLAIIFTTLLEYITSFVMEKLFHAKWWDYSNMPFNVNGRICLLNSILFGILGLVATYFIHPYAVMIVEKIPNELIPIITNILLMIISIDFAFSLNSILNLKDKLSNIKNIADSLKEKRKIQDRHYINKLESIKKDLSNKHSFESNRIIKAFPDLKFEKLNDELLELKNYLNERKQARKEEKKLKKEIKKHSKKAKF